MRSERRVAIALVLSLLLQLLAPVGVAACTGAGHDAMAAPAGMAHADSAPSHDCCGDEPAHTVCTDGACAIGAGAAVSLPSPLGVPVLPARSPQRGSVAVILPEAPPALPFRPPIA
jgi:hypothetical protein